MTILGIDSSGMVASAAIVSDDTLVAEFTVNNKKTHSQTLLPMIEKVVDYAGIPLEQIDGIAIASGPGSFTGLRIGASTAKGLALALNKDIVAVPTLEGLAYQVACTDALICPLMDARRNQVYTAVYKMDGEKLQVVEKQDAVSIDEILQKLSQYKEKVIFLGDGVPVHRKKIEETVQGEYSFAPIHMARQSAAAVAVLGAIYAKEGKMESADFFHPDYLRKSQAERERAERLGEN